LATFFLEVFLAFFFLAIIFLLILICYPQATKLHTTNYFSNNFRILMRACQKLFHIFSKIKNNILLLQKNHQFRVIF